MDRSISLTCVFPLSSKPYALRPVRTEEPVHLQIPAAVLMVGLEALAVKVREAYIMYRSK